MMAEGNNNDLGVNNDLSGMDPSLMAALAAAGISTGSVYDQQASLKDPPVYMGPGAVQLDLGSAPLTNAQKTVPGRNIVSSSAAVSQWYEWEEDERKALAKKLFDAGIIGSAADMDAAFRAWSAAVSEAANYQQVGKDVTPWQILENQGSYNRAAGIGPGGGQVPKARDQTNTSYSYLDEGQATVTAKSMFRQATGRDPNEDELNSFVTQIVSLSKQSPSVTKTHTDVEGNTTSRFTPGFTEADAQQAIDTKLAADPETGAYQAVSMYYPLLEQLMGGA